MDGRERTEKLVSHIKTNFDSILTDLKFEFSELTENQLKEILFDKLG